MSTLRALPDDERDQLRTALRWLVSHRRRLAIDRRALESQLGHLVTEIERLDREIERAEARLRELPGGPDQRTS